MKKKVILKKREVRETIKVYFEESGFEDHVTIEKQKAA